MRRGIERLIGVGVAVLCLALGAYLWAAHADEADLQRGNEFGLQERYREAIAAVSELDRDPAASRAAAVRGYAHAGRREYERSAEAFSQALRRDPNDWALHRDYGQVLLALGRREKARARMRRALALNPRMTLPVGFAAVNDR